jgi:hypothetical protein
LLKEKEKCIFKSAREIEECFTSVNENSWRADDLLMKLFLSSALSSFCREKGCEEGVKIEF